jgi:hypothetical protein
MVYLPMVRPQRFATHQGTDALIAEMRERLAPTLQANQGATWLIGNEPDNIHQDNQTPAAYAAFYHTAYHVIKAVDPTAQVAMAPVTAVTPLRLRYLDEILRTYQTAYASPLPVDVWTMHLYILSETGDSESGTWGIGVPPGLERYVAEAQHFTQQQHDDLTLFAQQISDFRAWLAARGYRNTPLYLTEYGLLLSAIHGFDEARVQAFMLGSFGYLSNARGAAIGYPGDENRLVQRWAWFSLNYYAFDPIAGSETGSAGLNGNLFDHSSGAITALGRTFATYTERLYSRTVDLTLQPIITTTSEGAAQQLAIINRGDAVAQGFRLRLWWGRHLLGTVSSTAQVEPHCGNTVTIPLQWLVALDGVTAPLHIQLLPAIGQLEYDPADNWGLK